MNSNGMGTVLAVGLGLLALYFVVRSIPSPSLPGVPAQ